MIPCAKTEPNPEPTIDTAFVIAPVLIILANPLLNVFPKVTNADFASLRPATPIDSLPMLTQSKSLRILPMVLTNLPQSNSSINVMAKSSIPLTTELTASATDSGFIAFIPEFKKLVSCFANPFQLSVFANPATKSNVPVILFPMYVPTLPQSYFSIPSLINSASEEPALYISP